MGHQHIFELPQPVTFTLWFASLPECDRYVTKVVRDEHLLAAASVGGNLASVAAGDEVGWGGQGVAGSSFLPSDTGTEVRRRTRRLLKNAATSPHPAQGCRGEPSQVGFGERLNSNERGTRNQV